MNALHQNFLPTKLEVLEQIGRDGIIVKNQEYPAMGEMKKCKAGLPLVMPQRENS